MKKTTIFLALISLSVVVSATPTCAITLQSQEIQQADFEVFPIQDIQVEGTKRMQAPVRSLFQFNKRGLYTQQDLNDFLKKVEAKGWFQNVSVTMRGKTLVVTVMQEQPTINRIVVQGNKNLSDEELKKIIPIKPRQCFNRPQIALTAQVLKEVYKQRGYYNMQLKVLEVDHPRNRKDIIFEINEGEAFAIKEMVFVGNKTFSDKTLMRITHSKIKRWYDFLSAGLETSYDPERLEHDAQRITEFYQKQGYADMRVCQAYGAIRPQDHAFVLTFMIQEGPRYQFGKTSFAKSSLTPDELACLTKEIMWKEGDCFNASRLKKVAQKMTALLNEWGQPFLDVTYEVKDVKPSPKCTPQKEVIFLINSNPAVYVGPISIKGNTITHDSVIRRQIDLKPGDPLNPTKLTISRQKIESLGFFENVEITRSNKDEKGKTPLDVTVKDVSTGKANLGFGYDTSSGFIGKLGFNEPNFLGRGYDFDAQTVFAKNNFSISTGVTIPQFLNRNMDLFFNVDITRSKEQTKGDNVEKKTDKKSYYVQNTLGFQVGLSYNLSKHLSQSLSYRISYDRTRFPNRILPSTDIQEKAEGMSLLIENNLSEHKNIILSTFTHTLVYQRLHNLVGEPIGGWFVKMTNNFHMGRNIKVLLNEIHFRKYHSFDDDGAFLLRIDAMAGHVLKIGDMRYSDQFFLGGRSLPGFHENGVGPRDLLTNDALGGKTVYSGSIKFFCPTGLLPKDWPVQFVAHATCGGLGTSMFKGIKIRNKNRVGSDTPSLRASVGAGIVARIPLIGSLGIIFSKILKKGEMDRRQTILITYGYDF